MSNYKNTSGLVDGVLNFLVIGGSLAAAIAAPNILQALDKPLDKYFQKMDKRAQAREMQRVLRYMKQQGLIRGEYEHGLVITKKGKKRIEQVKLTSLSIEPQKPWDKSWRIIFYDIPEKHKSARDALTNKLRRHGFWQLQRSVWVYPFPCREEILALTTHYGINKYVSYIEAGHIDNSKRLVEKFKARKIM